MEKYDFVILGAGSAGCVLANKLSANPNFKVCLIEAGSKDSDLEFIYQLVLHFGVMVANTAGTSNCSSKRI